MKSIKNILVITPNYPFDGEPVFTFVRNICNEFATRGYIVTIIATQSLTSAIKHCKKPRHLVRYENIDGNRITIYQPYTITLSYKHWNLYNYMRRLGTLLFLKYRKITPDVCYCHFWTSAYEVLPFVKKNHIPLFVATGEGDFDKQAIKLRSPKYLEISQYINGAISVSTNNKKISQEIGLLNGKDCIVLPNSINNAIFYKKNRNDLRKKYNYAQEYFIVAFVGWFNERKGSNRLSEAINKVDDVKSFFIGSEGESAWATPQCKGILFKGRLPHDIIPDYLNMADIFVLPTLNEGCSNAIVEALACGLPVVSSKLPFNFDVLNETNSIMVDPMNVDEIAAAIKELKDNRILRKQLSEGALRAAEELTISNRAQKIVDFMEEHIESINY